MKPFFDVLFVSWERVESLRLNWPTRTLQLWLDNFLGGAVGKRVEYLNVRRCIFSWEEIGFCHGTF
jgi:hypothetical protein